MGLSEALVMQQNESRRSPRRIDPILDRTYSEEAKHSNSTFTISELKPVSTKTFRTEQKIDLKTKQFQNDLSAQSKPQNKSTKENVSCKIENRFLSMSMVEKTIQANTSLSYSKGDEDEILKNKNLNDERQNKVDEKSLCKVKDKLCNLVSENFRDQKEKYDVNKNDKFTVNGEPKLETNHCGIQNAEKENLSSSMQKGDKIAEKAVINGKELLCKATAKEGKENVELDRGINFLEKQMAEMEMNTKRELTKENIVKHAKALRKLLLKIKVKESANAEAPKNSLQSPQEEEEGLVERSPVQQSFVNAPLQSGSIVTQDTSQILQPDALLNISDDSLDWNMLSDVDVLTLYSNHPELFDGILDCFVQDNASLSEMGGAGTNTPHTVLPEPVVNLNNELSNSPQATFMSSPRSEFSAVNSPNAYSEQLQYVPSTPYAPSLASSVTSPPSLFLPGSPQGIQNQELEKLSPENFMYIQTMPNTPDFNEVPFSTCDSRNADNMMCDMDMNVLANAVDTAVVGNTATANEITSTTMNPSDMAGKYLPEFSGIDSLSTWLNVKTTDGSSTSTNHECSQHQVLPVNIPHTPDSLPQSDRVFNVNSNSSSISSSNSSSNTSTGPTRIFESIRRAPSAPSTITESATSRLERMLNPNVKVNAIINISKFNDQEISQGDENGDTHLMILVSKPVKDQYELVYALVERLKKLRGNPLAAVNENEESALLLSSVLLPDHPLIARYIAEALLETGAPLDQVDSGRRSPIHHLAEYGLTHFEVLRELMSLRDINNMPCFNVNRYCEEGTPLHIAVRNHHTRLPYGKEIDCGSTVLFLISQGADVNAKDSQGQTVLHLAIRGACDPCLLQILLRFSPQLVNVKDNNGDTPLHCAAMRNDLSLQRQANVVRLLINNGACRNIIGSNGRVPLGLVAPERKHAIAVMLQRR